MIHFANLFASGGDISTSSARRYPTSRCERRSGSRTGKTASRGSLKRV